jgi:hypothetical protein
MNDHDRAVRYRHLALGESDKAKAALLQKIADEAKRGVLCTVDRKLPIPQTLAQTLCIPLLPSSQTALPDCVLWRNREGVRCHGGIEPIRYIERKQCLVRGQGGKELCHEQPHGKYAHRGNRRQ